MTVAPRARRAVPHPERPAGAGGPAAGERAQAQGLLRGRRDAPRRRRDQLRGREDRPRRRLRRRQERGLATTSPDRARVSLKRPSGAPGQSPSVLRNRTLHPVSRIQFLITRRIALALN